MAQVFAAGTGGEIAGSQTDPLTDKLYHLAFG